LKINGKQKGGKIEVIDIGRNWDA